SAKSPSSFPVVSTNARPNPNPKEEERLARVPPPAGRRERERMTTAARPTWAPAKGGNEQGGTRIFGPSGKYSSRDLAAHTSLKPRKEGQQTQEEVQKRNLRDELEERERKHFSSKDKSYVDERDRRKSSSLLLEGSKRDEDKIVPREIDADDSDVELKSDDERSV
uniref:Uncharacterized protein n=1 Tax=Aegilops tauschii subsp. strangulata TaxID=200361 RepID=A0A453QCB7_AEGTS